MKRADKLWDLEELWGNDKKYFGKLKFFKLRTQTNLIDRLLIYDLDTTKRCAAYTSKNAAYSKTCRQPCQFT